MDKGLFQADDGRTRCWWCGDDEQYQHYHDVEWGRPVTDDRTLFEKISLEGFQAGLSWLTILRKRENFRAAFANFDIETIAKFDDGDVQRLLQDTGIVRHRGKIEAVINNAQRAIELVEKEGSLAKFAWHYEPSNAERPERCDYASLMTLGKTPFSTAMSKELKKRGWKFVGPTTVYAFMQAMGLVNDHLEGCFRRPEVEQLRTQTARP